MNFFWKHHCQMKNSHNYYFTQDGAPAHQDKVVQSYLAEKFGDKFISKDKWPSRSPDLNACDYFLWGHLKSCVYKPLPKTLDDLKVNIERKLKNISLIMLENVFKNFFKRCEFLKDAKGNHFERK